MPCISDQARTPVFAMHCRRDSLTSSWFWLHQHIAHCSLIADTIDIDSNFFILIWNLSSPWLIHGLASSRSVRLIVQVPELYHAFFCSLAFSLLLLSSFLFSRPSFPVLFPFLLLFSLLCLLLVVGSLFGLLVHPLLLSACFLVFSCFSHILTVTESFNLFLLRGQTSSFLSSSTSLLFLVLSCLVLLLSSPFFSFFSVYSSLPLCWSLSLSNMGQADT